MDDIVVAILASDMEKRVSFGVNRVDASTVIVQSVAQLLLVSQPTQTKECGVFLNLFVIARKSLRFRRAGRMIGWSFDGKLLLYPAQP